MSKRDRGLLDAAGLSVIGAEALFNRSRQAIYQGLSQERDYFGVEERSLIIHDCLRRDNDRVDQVIRYIAMNYPESDCELIIPSRIANAQLRHAFSDASKVVIQFNGNVEHLLPSAVFAHVASNIRDFATGRFRLVVPGQWAADSVRRQTNLGIPAECVVEFDDAEYQPSLALIEQGANVRAFCFGKISADELLTTEARKLWEHLPPMNWADIQASDREAS